MGGGGGGGDNFSLGLICSGLRAKKHKHRQLDKKAIAVFAGASRAPDPKDYRDANAGNIMMRMGDAYTASDQEAGTILQKYCDRDGRCAAILFNP